jgi:HSP20 family protein
MKVRDIVPWKSSEIAPGTQSKAGLDDPFLSFQKRMNSLVEGLFDRAPGRWPGALEAFTPKVEVSEKHREVIVTAELPGMEDKDVELSVDDDVLTIRGEKKEEREEEREGSYYSERSFGSFQRLVRLPAPVDRDRAKATFRKGVLTVRLPKTEAGDKTRRIRIET